MILLFLAIVLAILVVVATSTDAAEIVGVLSLILLRFCGATKTELLVGALILLVICVINLILLRNKMV